MWFVGFNSFTKNTSKKISFSPFSVNLSNSYCSKQQSNITKTSIKKKFINPIESVVISNTSSQKATKYLHPWVFKDDVKSIKHLFKQKNKKEKELEEKGKKEKELEEKENKNEDECGIVQVLNENNKFIGNAFYSSNSSIALRIFSYKNVKFLSNLKHPPTKEFWISKIRNSIQKRDFLCNDDDVTAYRLINSESDFFPSFIVDKYNDAIIFQTLTQTTSEKNFQKLLINILKEELSPNLIIERNDSPIRSLEGLPSVKKVHHYSPSPLIQLVNEGTKDKDYKTIVYQNGLKFNVSLLNGQKTGLFLDQRENYFAARKYSKVFNGKGRALDCFTYHGGFALNIASSFEQVDAIDRSETSISIAKENAKLNNISNINYYVADVFDELRRIRSEGKTEYDMIILDPPAFTKSKETVTSALKGYKDINFSAMKLLKHEGLLVSCSCSFHISESDLLNAINDAARDARVHLQLLEKRQQSSDHPVLTSVPESYYLKCLIFKVLKAQEI